MKKLILIYKILTNKQIVCSNGHFIYQIEPKRNKQGRLICLDCEHEHGN